MIYSSRENSYTVLSTVFKGQVNDCYLAKNPDRGDQSVHTLIVIKDHETVKDLMEIFRLWKNKEGSPLLECFSTGREFCLVFPYRIERELSKFFVGEAFTLKRCEDICENVILSCIASSLPPALLYLILDQEKLNLSKDDSVYLSYTLDLKDLDKTKNEKDCATECAKILLEILATKASEKNISYVLLSKKMQNRSYSRFTEIYRDLKIASTPAKKRNIITIIKSFFYRNADSLFGILFWISLILMIVALGLLFSHLVLGDIPILRIFFNSFKNIGTESLLQ